MTHLTVRIFICLIIHTQCCYGEVKEASTTSTCFLRPPNRFRGPPGFSGKPGEKGQKGETLTVETGNLEDTVAHIQENITGIFATIRRGYMELNDRWITPFNGFQYKIVTTPQSWNDSRRLCREMGGDLATDGIQNWETRRIILDAFDMHGNFWVGVVFEVFEGRWRWINGQGFLTRETALWMGLEPAEVTNLNCGIIPKFHLFMLGLQCDHLRNALCQKSV